MRKLSRLAMPAGLAVAALFTTGCPETLAPVLTVTPAALTFGQSDTLESIAIRNSGGGALHWTVAEDIAWLTADTLTGSSTGEIDRVRLRVDREGMAPGAYNAELTVDSDAGAKTVFVSMSVGEDGSPALEVSPPEVNLLGNEESVSFEIANPGDAPLGWSLLFQDPDTDEAVSQMPAYAQPDIAVGTLSPGAAATVNVALDWENMPQEPRLSFRIDTDAGQGFFNLNLPGESAATLTVSPTNLDFGSDANTLTFEVYNTGDVGSQLNFDVTTDSPGLVLLEPVSGTSVGVDGENYERVPIEVTVDRSQLADSDGLAAITVTAPGETPVEVTVRVEAAALVFEGAMNRSRPPFILRFVFLLRDGAGNAIDVANPAVLAEVAQGLTITEDERELDLNETEVFIDGPEGLRYNSAVMLDLSGSMYHGGPGEGAYVQDMKDAVAGFIQDMVDAYDDSDDDDFIATPFSLMEHHDRQQADRVINDFTQDGGLLLEAIEDFRLPESEHGASDLYEAIEDAVARLESQDTGALPLDDADVRSLIFITDGRDSSSIVSLTEVIDTARQARVRLYPVSYGDDVDAAPLIQLATETGGHYYPAPTRERLQEVFFAPGAANKGEILTDLERQLVLTYISLIQDGSHTYAIQGEYRGLEGQFESDAELAIGGDVRAGQLVLHTTGIEQQTDGSYAARVTVRTPYVPRGVTEFRFRFGFPGQAYAVSPELAPGGLLDQYGWEQPILTPPTDDPDDAYVYTVATTADNPLPYGSFGELLVVHLENLPMSDPGGGGGEPEALPFEFDFRVDNRIYVNPPITKFFQHPEALVVDYRAFTSSVTPISIDAGFDPNAPFAWDRDEDGTADFHDRFPDDNSNS